MTDKYKLHGDTGKSDEQIRKELSERGVNLPVLDQQKAKEFSTPEPGLYRKQEAGKFNGLTIEKGQIPRVEKALDDAGVR